MFRLLFLSVLVAILAACAPVTRRPEVDDKLSAVEREKQRELVLREQVRRQERLDRVGSRVLAAAAQLCGEKVTAGTGARAVITENFKEEWRGTAARIFDLGKEPVILYVLAGSPAETAGLRAGDRILGLAGKKVDRGENARMAWEALLRENLRPGQPVAVALSRGGETLSVSLVPEARCDYPIQADENDAVNAWADGKRIAITYGMLRFAETDDELALVIGHELAHNILRHVDKKMGNSIIGAIIGAVISVRTGVDVTGLGRDIGAIAYSQEFEAEADYAGLYYTARAGYDIANAAQFWRRMAIEHPRAISHGVSHPDTASRFVAIEATAREIEGKRTAGKPLEPELKDAPAKE